MEGVVEIPLEKIGFGMIVGIGVLGIINFGKKTSGLEVTTRRPRSASMLKEILKNKYITFNENGQPEGEHVTEFTIEVGVYTRTRISINIPSWKKVSKNEPDQLWFTIKGDWNIKDDKNKVDVLKSYGIEAYDPVVSLVNRAVNRFLDNTLRPTGSRNEMALD